MSQEHGHFRWSDIQEDLDSTSAATRLLAEFDAGRRHPVRTRGRFDVSLGLTPNETPVGAGRRLIARCGKDTRERYETLLDLEEWFRPDREHGILILQACLMLEGELDRLLTAPARGLAACLIDALEAGDGSREQAAILRKWAAGSPTTIGVQSIVLLALRRGCEPGKQLGAAAKGGAGGACEGANRRDNSTQRPSPAAGSLRTIAGERRSSTPPGGPPGQARRLAGITCLRR